MDARILNNVGEILLPLSGELPLMPSIGINEPISRAIEIMVRHNLSILAVVRNERPVGQVRIQDAFAFIGLRLP